MSLRLGVIDHHAGNLVSVRGGFERSGATVVMIEEPEQIIDLDGLVLPGVGAAAPAMARLREKGLDQALRHWEGPLLGICLGMQLLFDGSEELGGSDALGLISGRVRPLPSPPRSIHIGWNDLSHDESALFEGIPQGEPFYFVHSLAAEPADPRSVTGRADYGGEFVAAVARDLVSGVQFHPERSASAGLRVLTNFVEQVRCAA